MKRSLFWALPLSVAICAAVLMLAKDKSKRERYNSAYDLSMSVTAETQVFQLSGPIEVEKIWNSETRSLSITLLANSTVTFRDKGKSDPNTAQAIASMLSGGITAQLNSDGSIETLLISKDSPKDFAEVAWKMLNVFITNSDDGVSQRTEERLGGSMKVLYDRTANFLKKSVVSVSSLNTKGNVVKTIVKKSETVCAYLDDGESLPKTCSSVFVYISTYQSQLVNSNSETIQLRQIAQRAGGGVSVSTNSARTQSLSLDLKRQIENGRMEMARRTLGSTDFSSLMEIFVERELGNEEARAGELSLWMEKMRAFLLLHPSRTQEFVTAFGGFAPDSQSFALLPHLLAVSGTQEAQAALGDLLTKHGTDRPAAYMIVTQLHQLKEPNAVILNQLMSYNETQSDPVLRNVSTLALGSLAGSAMQGGNKAAKDILELFVHRLEAGKPDTILMGALGNAAWQGSLEPAKALLLSDEESIRIKAVEMLRFVPSEEAMTVLKRVIEGPSDHRARAKAVEMLSFRDVNSSLAAYNCRHALDETSSMVRHAFLQNLSAWKDLHGCVGEVVAALESRETDQDLKIYLSHLKRQLSASR